MALHNCWTCGSVLPRGLFSKGHVFYIRQYYVLRDGTTELFKSHHIFQPTISVFRSRCLATKVKVPKPRPRSPDADKKTSPSK